MLRRFFTHSVQVAKYSSKKLQTKHQPHIQLVSCKVKKYDLRHGDKLPDNSKFGSIPLASSGWKHDKSRGDFFIIHPIPAENNLRNEQSKSFEHFGLHSKIVENLQTNLNISKCSSIQLEGMPLILSGDHTLLAAETGCGKTLAYLVPIVQNIFKLKEIPNQKFNFNTPLGLILTPGRELGKINNIPKLLSMQFIIFITATQIGEVATKLCAGLDIKVKVVLGGRTKQKMLNPEIEDVDLLIGSMGAISKLVTTNVYRMQQCRHVVLDEADTLLDDSFNHKLVYFLSKFPVKSLVFVSLQL